MQEQTEGNLHNNWVDTRRMYKAAMIEMLMHIFPDLRNRVNATIPANGIITPA
jgi:hypothetical protein